MIVTVRPVKIYSLFLLLVSTITVYSQGENDKNKIIQYVNPFIGTGGHGHTYPGATVPFGMVQLSPDNGTQGWDWCSGYHYSDSVIAGFSHTHLSGTGIGDLLDISVFPVVNTPPSAGNMVSKFSHSEESASPGYYSVMLKDFNIKAELTASERCGFHRYTFPASTDAMIRFNLGQEINWDKMVDASFEQINDSTFVGYRFSTGWARDQKVYFAVRLNKPSKLVKFTKTDQPPQKSTKYLTFHSSGWIQFQSANAQVATKYAITSANDSPERDPHHWILQGSTNGSTWITLDTRSNENFPDRLQRKEFAFNNSKAYLFYKMNITARSGNMLQVDEWEIFNSDGKDITNPGGTISAQFTDSPDGEGITNVIDNYTPKITGLKSKVTAACLTFNTNHKEQVFMKVGLSSASIEGALMEINSSTSVFENARRQAESLWDKELRKIEITTKNKAVKEIFYTALYHTYLGPVIFSDAQGHYKSVNGGVAQTSRPIYTVSSLWDVFRAQSPLLTLVQPERVPDIINSYLTFYRESGLLPVWDLYFNETNTMTGYHCVPIIADAILKNVEGINRDEAYEAMKKSAMQNIRGTDLYRQFGYVPQNKQGMSVTITLEYAYDDWCIAQVAKTLGKSDDYEIFMKRSAYWKNLFDSSTGFIRAKNSDGSWVTPFDPYHSDHDERKAMYTEGNAWQHSWFVPHDVYGLINAHGGEQPFIKKLDSLFTISSVLKGDNVSPDISGLVGQYAQGNEPSHHIAYLYNYAGTPHKTADRVNYITHHLYTNKPDGLSGNEDCGQMSAWYVFSALGFYPVNPAVGRYIFGTPLMDTAVIKLPSGKTFTISAMNLSDQNIYIQKATLNGKPYPYSFINHSDIINGGTLVLYMSNTPSKTWGVKKKHKP
jgi:putative alpha-1,2-mannosidase